MADLDQPYADATRAALLMVGLNGLLCVGKLSVGWMGGSYALMADGINNLADVGVSIALYVGMHIARRPADREHAYGHGKFEHEVSRLISMVVLVTGGGIVVGGVNRLSDVHNPPELMVLVVALVAILVKLFMYRYQHRLAKQYTSQALAADALNHRADVGATACVFVGTAAIWIGGPSWAPADDVAAILIGVLMAIAAGQTIREASSDLLDRMPPDELVTQIRTLAQSFPGVTGVDTIMGRKTGMHYLIDLHLEVPGKMTVTEAHLLGHQVKDWLMAELPHIRDLIVHIEPTPDFRDV